MKTVNSGIIRRMDDLGRVVIPKEMRRLANIKEGDPFEVGVANGCIILEKYTGEIDEETGLPIPKPQVSDGSPVQAVKREPQKYYIDVCDRRAFTTIEGIINVMEANGDISSFEEFLCQEYTAGALYDMYATHGIEKTENKLDQEYMEYAKNQAQDLLDSLSITDYIEVYI
jgi:AbrB family looped-hinge helix DNA binding protein